MADSLLKNFTVAIEWKDDKRVQRTTARFPFVQHIACEACLNGQSSPTAIVNSNYGQLVEGVDHYLYDYLLRLAGYIECQSRNDCALALRPSDARSGQRRRGTRFVR
jgi:hypothetical protein